MFGLPLVSYCKSTKYASSSAVPMITSAVGIIDWTIEEIYHLGINTIKPMTMAKNIQNNKKTHNDVRSHACF